MSLVVSTSAVVAWKDLHVFTVVSRATLNTAQSLCTLTNSDCCHLCVVDCFPDEPVLPVFLSFHFILF